MLEHTGGGPGGRDEFHNFVIFGKFIVQLNHFFNPFRAELINPVFCRGSCNQRYRRKAINKIFQLLFNAGEVHTPSCNLTPVFCSKYCSHIVENSFQIELPKYINPNKWSPNC